MLYQCATSKLQNTKYSWVSKKPITWMQPYLYNLCAIAKSNNQTGDCLHSWIHLNLYYKIRGCSRYTETFSVFPPCSTIFRYNLPVEFGDRLVHTCTSIGSDMTALRRVGIRLTHMDILVFICIVYLHSIISSLLTRIYNHKEKR